MLSVSRPCRARARLVRREERLAVLQLQRRVDRRAREALRDGCEPRAAPGRARRRRAARSNRAPRCARGRPRSRVGRRDRRRVEQRACCGRPRPAAGGGRPSCTAATASAGGRPPTRTPATRTPAGSVCPAGGVVSVVVVVCRWWWRGGGRRGSRRRRPSTWCVEVVTSAITAPENAPATAKPSTKRTTACRRFTAQAV